MKKGPTAAIHQLVLQTVMAVFLTTWHPCPFAQLCEQPSMRYHYNEYYQNALHLSPVKQIRKVRGEKG